MVPTVSFGPVSWHDWISRLYLLLYHIALRELLVSSNEVLSSYSRRPDEPERQITKVACSVYSGNLTIMPTRQPSYYGTLWCGYILSTVYYSSLFTYSLREVSSIAHIDQYV